MARSLPHTVRAHSSRLLIMAAKYLLIVLRHGKSLWDNAALNDFERPLSPRGGREVPLIAHWLRDHCEPVGAMISSPARRAYESALLAAQVLDFPPSKIHFDRRLYDAGPEDWVKVFEDVALADRVIVAVGHNPELEAFLRFICKDDLPRREDGKTLTTAAAAGILSAKPWTKISRGCGQLQFLMRPADIA